MQRIFFPVTISENCWSILGLVYNTKLHCKFSSDDGKIFCSNTKRYSVSMLVHSTGRSRDGGVASGTVVPGAEFNGQQSGHPNEHFKLWKRGGRGDFKYSINLKSLRRMTGNSVINFLKFIIRVREGTRSGR